MAQNQSSQIRKIPPNMFERLGEFVSRAWWAILLVWVGGLIWLSYVTPEVKDVSQAGEFNFLPDTAVTRQGEVLFDRAFPSDTQQSSVVIVLARNDGQPLVDSDYEFIEDSLKPRLQSLIPPGTGDSEETTENGDAAGTDANSSGNATPAVPVHPYGTFSEILRVRTPGSKEIGKLLVSDDKLAALVIVDLSQDYMTSQIRQPVGGIETVLQSLRDEKLVPGHLNISLSGSAVAGRDIGVAQSRSAHSIERWTLILVVSLLLIVYRAPLPVLVPFATLVVSLKISMRLLAWAAQQGWIGLFEGIEVYTVVVAYGAGVDFSMFLTSRFHEEIQRHRTVHDALVHTLKGVGPAVVAAAGTVIFGIGMMTFATFGKFHQAGISISFSLFVILCAAMTFTPSLLRLMGRYTFWPEMPAHGVEFRVQQVGLFSRFIRRVTLQEESHRFWVWLACKITKAPVLTWAITMLIMLPGAIIGALHYDSVSYGLISSLRNTAPSVQGTQDVAAHFSPGLTGPVTLLIEQPDIDFSLSEGTAAIQELSDNLQKQAGELEISDIRSAVFPLGLHHQLDEAPTANRPRIGRIFRGGVQRTRIREHFLGTKEESGVHTTRLEILLNDDPFARTAITKLTHLETALPGLLPESLKTANIHLLGATASLRDLEKVASADRTRITVLVTVAVFVVLVMLIRSVPDSLYLMGTVIFSFLCTLGVSYLLFWWLDPVNFPGLDWTVPTFLFTILVAVGQDYNIFLVTRIHEERPYHGQLGGVRHAVVQTAAIITSCGLIMAGTFSAMVVGGELARMTQLGFALAFGVLLDTMIVRPILVPAYFAWRARHASDVEMEKTPPQISV